MIILEYSWVWPLQKCLFFKSHINKCRMVSLQSDLLPSSNSQVPGMMQWSYLFEGHHTTHSKREIRKLQNLQSKISESKGLAMRSAAFGRNENLKFGGRKNPLNFLCTILWPQNIWHSLSFLDTKWIKISPILHKCLWCIKKHIIKIIAMHIYGWQ